MSKIVIYLSSIISFRFLGLFIVLPVISIYATSLENSNEFLVGISVGVYALSQMFFQVPFGHLSDRIGRKKTIILGLIIFLFGSLICFVATDIYIFIIGRVLQGLGAIGAVITAMISDFTEELKRAKAMATMGGFIALSFALAMFIGPLFQDYFEVRYLFLFTTFLIILSLVILITKVPEPPKLKAHFSEKASFSSILFDKKLIVMNITNLLQKSLMTATFVIVPLEFLARFQDSKLIWLYLPALILGVFAMAPSAIFAEKKNKFKEVLMVGIMIFAISYFTLGFFDSKLSFILGVALFFIAFNVHEPIMQSLTSKIAKANQRGTALGIFNSFGYFGTFVGGLGGSMFVGDLMSLAILVIVISILWLLLVSRMENPANIKILFLNESEYSNIESIKTLNGVIEAFIKEAQIVIKYDIKTIKEREILEFLSNNK